MKKEINSRLANLSDILQCAKKLVKAFDKLHFKSNLHYAPGITSKRVTSGGVHLRGLAPEQHSSEETSQRWRDVGDTVSDLTDLELPNLPHRWSCPQPTSQNVA